MSCTNYVDISDTFQYNDAGTQKKVKGWGERINDSQNFDLIDDFEIDELLMLVDDLPGIKDTKSGKLKHLKFNQVSDEIGEKLLEPIRGQCFSEFIDIWKYNFCVG